jgi:hypothetical protein
MIMHKTARRIFFGFAILLWLATAGFVFFEGEGLLFFSLGIWIQKTDFNIDKPIRLLNPVWWGIIFIGICTLKTILAFKGEPLMGNSIFPVLTIMHKITILSGLIVVWYGCNRLVSFMMQQKWFTWISAFSFMIYAMHAPLVAYATEGVFAVVSQFPYYRLLTFLILPLIIILMIIGFSALLRSTMPKLYEVLTGGRGM